MDNEYMIKQEKIMLKYVQNHGYDIEKYHIETIKDVEKIPENEKVEIEKLIVEWVSKDNSKNAKEYRENWEKNHLTVG